MNLADLAGRIEGVSVRSMKDGAGALDAVITGLTADSRDVAPGFLFAALEGVAADGAAYIPQAIKQGAVAILGRAGLDTGDVPLLATGNPRRALAQAAAAFYPGQPEVVCAVTGTNGKTSVASFLRQIWAAQGLKAASIGTLGVVTGERAAPLSHTTPDPVEIHRVLDGLAQDGITHAAMEASSHGLAQYRLDGVKLVAGALTNITRDHLDYHASFEDYVSAKLRLFTGVIAPGGTAVLNADCESFALAREAAKAHGLSIIDVGERAEALRIMALSPEQTGLAVTVQHDGMTYDLHLPLVGAFQASNALIAAGLAMAGGLGFDRIAPALEALQGAEGRMQHVATHNGAAVFVDYAHTPDALETVLKAIRPHTEGRLHVVFGAGGDRDKGKRPQMGAVAARCADEVIVTDDNPRGEAPELIRAAIIDAARDAKNIGDRRAAIAAGLEALQKGDVLVVAGKGHESGQTIRGVTHPFKDADVIREILGAQA